MTLGGPGVTGSGGPCGGLWDPCDSEVLEVLGAPVTQKSEVPEVLGVQGVPVTRRS